MSETYYTHNNGSLPFKVTISNENILIYGISKTLSCQNEYEKFIMKIDDYLDVFIGKGNTVNQLGNSILVKITKNKYLFIGHNIFEFTTDDEIIKYYSPVHNNDVPYPYGVSELNTYLMLEPICIPNIVLHDPYAVHYGFVRKQKSTYQIKIISNM